LLAPIVGTAVFGCVCDSWPVFWTDPIGEERIIEPVRELEAASVGQISFYLPNDGACERIEEPRREIVSRYEQLSSGSSGSVPG
jgi:hypothetical protein